MKGYINIILLVCLALQFLSAKIEFFESEYLPVDQQIWQINNTCINDRRFGNLTQEKQLADSSLYLKINTALKED